MGTIVVVPRERSPEVNAAAASNSPFELHDATVAEVRRLLSRTEFANRSLLTERGFIPEARTDVVSEGLEAVERARDDGTTRVLSALGAVLLDNPSDEAIGKISQFADVFPNVLIPLVNPSDEGVETSSCTSWHLSKINIHAARSQGLKGSGVRLGVVDTGIDASHPEFSGKTIDFAEFDGSGFLTSTNPRDAGSHGTHVSALAAGATCGVAPDASLSVAAVLTFTDANGQLSGYLAQILGGLNWIAHSNFSSAAIPVSRCPLFNASLGGSGYNQYLQTSLQTINTVPAALLFAAIGNSGRKGLNNHGSPGNYDIVCGIGATDLNDDPAVFSDWGIEKSTGSIKPDMSAPGVDICSAVPGGKYALKSGTSMATPIVAGAAALLVEKYPNLARSPQGLFNRIMSLTDPSVAARPSAVVAGFNKIGRGRLDLTNI